MTPRDKPETIEAQLRAAAPAPPELRGQILRRCQNERRNTPALRGYRNWRLAGAFATFVRLCGIASSHLDAQNQAMLTGNERQTSERSFALPVESSNFVIALQWRIHELALLLHDKHSG